MRVFKLVFIGMILIPFAIFAADVDYYTCPMHPQIRSETPGQCPICGMDLVPVEKNAKGEAPHAHDTSQLTIDPSYVQRIGVVTDVVEKRSLVKTVRTSGKIAHDPELWVAQNDYVEALRLGNPELIKASEQRLLFMGLSPEWIARLGKAGKVENTLHLPSKSGIHYVEAYLYQGGVDDIRVGQAATIEDSAGQVLQRGSVAAVGTILDMESRTLRVLIASPQPFSLKPNTFVQVVIDVALGETLSVPRSAVIMNGDHSMVYVVEPNGVYLPKRIELGARADDFYEVTSGVSAGERVVTNGHFLIDSETQIRMGGMEHQH